MLFKFDHENGEFVLSFMYDESPNMERVTEAKLYSYNRETKEKIQIARGYSYCQPEDQFIKSKGRKIAVERLLNNLLFEPNSFNKAFRTEFWKQYFDQVADNKKLKR